MDVVFIEEARGTERLNFASSRTGQTDEISVFVEPARRCIDGLDDGARNSPGALAGVAGFVRQSCKHRSQLAYVVGDRAICDELLQAASKQCGCVAVEPVAVIRCPVGATLSDVGNQFAAKRGEWRPSEIGAPEMEAFRARSVVVRGCRNP